jgi:hypothetical protein
MVENDRAVSLLHSEVQLVEGSMSDVEQAIPQFETRSYPCFVAKHAVVGNDLVIQFYLPEAAGNLRTSDAKMQQRWASFWLETFRDALSPVAKEYFAAEYPTLVAKYTEEVASWWFCARGFGQTMVPQELAENFESKLNSYLTQRAG